MSPEEELHVMQLSAISVASNQNTATSVKERIDSSNPYWSVAYADVCRAVDREMANRAIAQYYVSEIQDLKKQIIELRGRGAG